MSIFLDLKILNRYVKYVFHAWIRTYVCKRYQFLNISKLFIIITLVGKLSYIISQWAKIRKEIAIQLLAIYTTVCFKIKNLWLFTQAPNQRLQVHPLFFWSRSLVVLNKSRILILHPHFSGSFDANGYSEGTCIMCHDASSKPGQV